MTAEGSGVACIQVCAGGLLALLHGLRFLWRVWDAKSGRWDEQLLLATLP
jgi:hypothetical protein